MKGLFYDEERKEKLHLELFYCNMVPKCYLSCIALSAVLGARSL